MSELIIQPVAEPRKSEPEIDFSSWSKKAQRRIDQLTKRAKEAQREADRLRLENAELMRALRFADVVAEKYRQLLMQRSQRGR
jgi:hypothetical protein